MSSTVRRNQLFSAFLLWASLAAAAPERLETLIQGRLVSASARSFEDAKIRCVVVDTDPVVTFGDVEGSGRFAVTLAPVNPPERISCLGIDGEGHPFATFVFVDGQNKARTVLHVTDAWSNVDLGDVEVALSVAKVDLANVVYEVNPPKP